MPFLKELNYSYPDDLPLEGDMVIAISAGGFGGIVFYLKYESYFYLCHAPKKSNLHKIINRWSAIRRLTEEEKRLYSHIENEY